jgi:gamma-glutamyltranspeptidase/glutathione hydrolase
MPAAVAAGCADTVDAAVEVLAAGGNAFDAVVAAGFASAVAEPGLASLGGGGFLLARPVAGPTVLFDFFVDSPGLGRDERPTPHFTPVTVRFAGAEQVFHAGWGSAAVPGSLAGYLHVHRRLGRVPLTTLVAPARRLAAEGVVLAPAQAAVLSLLEPIVTLSPEGRSVFAPRGRVLEAGDTMRNPDLAAFLDEVGRDAVGGFGAAGIAAAVESAMDSGGGLMTSADLAEYRVVERLPLRVDYRGGVVRTNPPPSFGGTIVATGLERLAAQPPLDGSPESFVRLAAVLVELTEGHGPEEGSLGPAGRPAEGPEAAEGPSTVPPRSVRGTTHVSVIDAEGNVAAMTTSNGSCSGVFVPGTGVQLNNVMGEADLHPAGFHAAPPGTRIGSMMAPTIVTTDAGGLVALGSGGSERIRSALTCVLTNLTDRGLGLDAAVLAPRLHWDRFRLQVEPGLPAEVVEQLSAIWPVSIWPGRDLYFGGAHAVLRAPDGSMSAVGDDRRGGVGRIVGAG